MGKLLHHGYLGSLVSTAAICYGCYGCFLAVVLHVNATLEI
jgi:hypothetical protein